MQEHAVKFRSIRICAVFVTSGSIRRSRWAGVGGGAYRQRDEKVSIISRRPLVVSSK